MDKDLEVGLEILRWKLSVARKSIESLEKQATKILGEIHEVKREQYKRDKRK